MSASTVVDSPIGQLYVETSGEGLKKLAFATSWKFNAARATDADREADPDAADILQRVLRQLEEYFAGSRQSFDIPLDVEGTPFQKRVWRAIADVPFARTISYSQLAAAAGSPNAYRAAGAACGANPAAVVVPCHRVVGSDRGLHGFGGGLPIKRWLLDHEASNVMATAARQAVLV